MRFLCCTLSFFFLLSAAAYGADKAWDDKEKDILTVRNPSPKTIPTLGVWQQVCGAYLVSAEFPDVPGLLTDAWCYESSVDYLGAKDIGGGKLRLTHRSKEYPNVIVVTTVTPEPGALEFVAQAKISKQAKGKIPPKDWDPPLGFCWQVKRAPAFSAGNDPREKFIARNFIFTESGLTTLDKTTRYKIPWHPEDHEYNNPVPWIHMYAPVWESLRVTKLTKDDWAGTSPERFTVPVCGFLSKDGKYLTALANGTSERLVQAWHNCIHNGPNWLPENAPLARRTWRVKVYGMRNDPEKLLARVENDFPEIKKLKSRPKARLTVDPDAAEYPRDEKAILTAKNPSPGRLPTLGVWQQREQLLVSMKFPNVPGFVCDSWCYESEVDFLDAKDIGGGAIELRHRVRKYPKVIIATRVNPEPGAVEFVARPTIDQTAPGALPPSGALLGPNMCWQLRRAAGFSRGTDPYPDFVKRCFIFTEQGRTFLDKTTRRPIPCRPADDPANNPPWVQMYVGTWQEVPKSGPTSWADYSPDRYVATIIGTVSRDGKYLAAIANDTSRGMAQAWHDCMHNNPQWTEGDAPLLEKKWRMKVYVMENDPDELLARAQKDFPGIKRQMRGRNAGTRQDYQKVGIKNNLPAFSKSLADRLTFPMSWLSGNYRDFGAWKKAARKKVTECMLALPPPAPFDPAVTAEEDRGSYVARKLVLNLTGDSRVLSYMLVPKGKGPFPAVLLLHDHGARFDIGKEKVIRSFGIAPEKLASAEQWVDQLYGGRYIGDELAKRGYVCFCTDALNWSDREGAGYEGQQALASNLMHLGATWAGTIAFEDMRAAEFLATRPEVDPKRVAAMGLSMGSFRTWQIAALSDRIKAGVAICWMATVKGLMSLGNNQTIGQSSYSMLHPGLFNCLDYPDFASLACPKPMLFYSGLQDVLFPVPSVKDAFEKMRKIWKSQHAEDKLVTKLWDVQHVFNMEMQEEAFAWLDRQMRKEGNSMQRFGSVIKVKPEKLEEYKRLHANVWPEVLKMIKECNIRNYSIYHKDGYLFSYFEYTGTDIEADMAKMAADPMTQKWWEVCKPCQEPLATRAEGEWWASMEEVFHCD
ncbi:MAG: L-rhamnose mutarotase [Armatimonadetes bacterium]|nr:L-rhamnose mutarotase [Armatimonadota bacterium]